VLSHAEFLVEWDIENRRRWLDDTSANGHRLLHVHEFVLTRALTEPSKLYLVLVELEPTGCPLVADVGGTIKWLTAHIIDAFQWDASIRLLIVSEQMVVDVMMTED